ncbi:hypothetical protein [Streptomyces sp. NPDC002265]|uniref:hypothetical protein n=1 Tax=Streptomyces sp. NPDC002265 TaxID=3154415 RepID=UPI00331A0A0F
MATGNTDFTPDDLTLVRRQFAARHVTLDGDTITVWPRTPPGRPPAPGPQARNSP